RAPTSTPTRTWAIPCESLPGFPPGGRLCAPCSNICSAGASTLWRTLPPWLWPVRTATPQTPSAPCCPTPPSSLFLPADFPPPRRRRRCSAQHIAKENDHARTTLQRQPPQERLHLHRSLRSGQDPGGSRRLHRDSPDWLHRLPRLRGMRRLQENRRRLRLRQRGRPQRDSRQV